MKYRLTQLFALLFTICIISLGLSSPVMAQDATDDVQSLPEILNNPLPNGSKPITPADLARSYYHKCVAKESLIFTRREQEILCSCTASGMATALTAKEIKHLERKTNTGTEARDKFRAFAYAPCMEYVVEDKVQFECYKTPLIKSLIGGKKAICQCTKERMKKFINDNASTIIINAARENPMTLDPLGDYFVRADYYGQRDYTIKQCYDMFRYNKDNR